MVVCSCGRKIWGMSLLLFGSVTTGFGMNWQWDIKKRTNTASGNNFSMIYLAFSAPSPRTWSIKNEGTTSKCTWAWSSDKDQKRPLSWCLGITVLMFTSLRHKYRESVFVGWFLAQLLLCYLTGNIFGVQISCRRRADDMWTMCRWHADDVRMTREWDFGWDLTGGRHMSSAHHLAQQLCIKPTAGFLVRI